MFFWKEKLIFCCNNLAFIKPLLVKNLSFFIFLFLLLLLFFCLFLVLFRSKCKPFRYLMPMTKSNLKSCELVQFFQSLFINWFQKVVINRLSSEQTFQRRFDVVFRLIWRRNVAQRQINVETTLSLSTLKFTT